MLQGKTILLGVTGGIAAYKAAALASALVKQHAHVEVIMTAHATQFITPLTFEQLTGNRCMVDTFDRNFSHQVEHIALADRTDLVIIAAHSAGSSGEGLLDEMEIDKGTTLVTISGGLSMHKVRQRCDRSILDFIKCYVYRINATKDYMKELFNVDVEEIDESVADCEIGDVITGKAPGRLNDEQIVNAAGIGMGIEDVVVANEIFKKALERGIGTVVDIVN